LPGVLILLLGPRVAAELCYVGCILVSSVHYLELCPLPHPSLTSRLAGEHDHR